MSLVSPPSEPKLMTAPVRSASKSATSPNRRPPTLSIATWIVAPSAAAVTRSFQPATCVAKTGDPGMVPVSFAALASLRTSLMTFAPRPVRTLPMRRPTADPAPVSSATTSVHASGGRESCAARITVRAVTVLISIRAPTSSGIESGNGTTELAGAGRGEEGHSEALLRPESRIDLGADLAHDAGAFKSGYPPAGGDRRRRSEGWRAYDPEKIAWMDRRVGSARSTF